MVPQALARDAAGVRALLEEAGLVHDEHTAGHISKLLTDVGAQVISDTVGIPGGLVEETLDTVRLGLPHHLGELPAVLALDAGEEAGQIAPHALAHFHSPKAVGDARVDVQQCF